MNTIPEIRADRIMSAASFVELALEVLEHQGYGDRHERRYEDDVVSIAENHLGLGLMIVRMARPVEDDALRRPNAVTIVDETGAILRHHAEHVLLVDHLMTLATEE